MERLRIEAQALAELDHYHIVRILGFDRTRTHRPFIVLEYLEGRTLAEELRAFGVPPVLEALSFASHLLSAVGAAHDKGLVHRDIKPDNVFICTLPDGRRYLKLIDFGIARVMPGSEAVEPMPFDLRTSTGVVVGTPRYVSPEAAVGEEVDPRGDVYNVGLVLYLMLAGRGPFDHLEGDDRLLRAHALDEPEPPSRFALEPVPPELDRAVLKALAKTPEDRFQAAEEFRSCLVQIADMIKRPAGWLETLAFDVSGMSEQPAPEPISKELPAPFEQPAARRAEPRQPTSSGARPAPVTSASGLDQRRATRAPGRPTQVILFVAGMLIAGLAVVGVVTLLQGARP